VFQQKGILILFLAEFETATCYSHHRFKLYVAAHNSNVLKDLLLDGKMIIRSAERNGTLETMCGFLNSNQRMFLLHIIHRCLAVVQWLK